MHLAAILCVLVCLIPSAIFAAASHKHTHGKERAEDGGFSPRDHEHFDQEGSIALTENLI